MKVGVYFPSSHLGEWSWQNFLNHEISLSGTDYRNLFLIYYLAKYGYEVFVFSTQILPRILTIKVIQVDSFATASIKAKDANMDILITSNRQNQDTVAGIKKCEEIHQPCIISSGNGPSPEIADLLFHSTSVRRLVCVSATQADFLRDHPIFDKTEFIYGNGVKPIYFSNSSSLVQRDSLGVCYLGSLTPSKGFHHVARAWPKIHQSFPNATLTVLGNAKLYRRDAPLGPLGIAEPEFEETKIIPYLGNTIAEAQSKGVQFLGLVSSKTIRSVAESSSVGVVNPNCSGSIETFCLSAIELQAAGATVVGANRGGLRETVRNQETGILINSEEELADAIIRLLSNPEQTRQMGEKGRRWVKEAFNCNRIIEQWCYLIEAVVRNEAAHPPNFSWKRATWKALAREGIRQARKVPNLGYKLPTLYQINLHLNKLKLTP
ncbi:MAG: glycosyltransferase [Cyanobacteria bacterium]|jgi:glycosyltransferase involved in cell wall biosynthesis|nr:glycosyltransferase [Cyanobacteria bacterium GSL.Bin1]